MAIEKTPSGKYKAVFSFYDEDGERHRPSKTFAYKADADAWMLEQKIDHAQGKVHAATKFSWYFKEYLKSKKHIDDPSNIHAIRPSTHRSWTSTLSAFESYFGDDITIDKLTKKNYQDFINWYSRTHKHSTTRGVHMMLKAVLEEAVADGYINRNPAVSADVGGQPGDKVRHFTGAELKKIAKYIRDTTFRSRNGHTQEIGTPYAILTEIYTGARVSELAGLTWDDLDFNKNTISITKQLIKANHEGTARTKTPESVRTIVVPHELLEDLLPLRAPEDKYVFRTRQNHAIASDTVNYLLKRICTELKIPTTSAHIHELRHAHVAMLLNSDVDISAISRRLGHANVRVTMETYAYLINEQKTRNDEKIVKALGTISNPDEDDKSSKENNSK